METSVMREKLLQGKTALGIELGSTRIKAVLIDDTHTPIASGDYGWENRLEDGVWVYHLEDAWTGLRTAYAALARDVADKYGVTLTRVGSIGISGMMHGYLVFDGEDRQLAPFRTWRNTITEQASAALSEAFCFNIPQRWGIAHLYQAILNGEAHLPAVRSITTLAGHIHTGLTGRHAVGLNEASGLFLLDEQGQYDARRLDIFDRLIADRHFPWTLRDILPQALPAGEDAGVLTEAGALLLDPTGTLQPGIPLCPPEGDAGTGMVATNSVAVRTGNISAGTSIFAMAVLEKPLDGVYPEIDMITTPSGLPVAMVHGNTCTSDLDAWVKLFRQTLAAFGAEPDINTLYSTLYTLALEGDPDCGGLLSYNFFAGEPVANVTEGFPLFARPLGSPFTLPNFMRALLYSAMGTIRMGMDILERENVRLDCLLGHGGLFKTRGVAQKLMAGALNLPVSVMETAGEGGAWGVAVLAAFRVWKQEQQTLESYLDGVFAGMPISRCEPDPADAAGFNVFMEHYREGITRFFHS